MILCVHTSYRDEILAQMDRNTTTMELQLSVIQAQRALLDADKALLALYRQIISNQEWLLKNAWPVQVAVVVNKS